MSGPPGPSGPGSPPTRSGPPSRGWQGHHQQQGQMRPPQYPPQYYGPPGGRQPSGYVPQMGNGRGGPPPQHGPISGRQPMYQNTGYHMQRPPGGGPPQGRHPGYPMQRGPLAPPYGHQPHHQPQHQPQANLQPPNNHQHVPQLGRFPQQPQQYGRYGPPPGRVQGPPPPGRVQGAPPPGRVQGAPPPGRVQGPPPPGRAQYPSHYQQYAQYQQYPSQASSRMAPPVGGGFYRGPSPVTSPVTSPRDDGVVNSGTASVPAESQVVRIPEPMAPLSADEAFKGLLPDDDNPEAVALPELMGFAPAIKAPPPESSPDSEARLESFLGSIPDDALADVHKGSQKSAAELMDTFRYDSAKQQKQEGPAREEAEDEWDTEFESAAPAAADKVADDEDWTSFEEDPPQQSEKRVDDDGDEEWGDFSDSANTAKQEDSLTIATEQAISSLPAASNDHAEVDSTMSEAVIEPAPLSSAMLPQVSQHEHQTESEPLSSDQTVPASDNKRRSSLALDALLGLESVEDAPLPELGPLGGEEKQTVAQQDDEWGEFDEPENDSAVEKQTTAAEASADEDWDGFAANEEPKAVEIDRNAAHDEDDDDWGGFGDDGAHPATTAAEEKPESGDDDWGDFGDNDAITEVERDETPVVEDEVSEATVMRLIHLERLQDAVDCVSYLAARSLVAKKKNAFKQVLIEAADDESKFEHAVKLKAEAKRLEEDLVRADKSVQWMKNDRSDRSWKLLMQTVESHGKNNVDEFLSEFKEVQRHGHFGGRARHDLSALSDERKTQEAAITYVESLADPYSHWKPALDRIHDIMRSIPHHISRAAAILDDRVADTDPEKIQIGLQPFISFLRAAVKLYGVSQRIRLSAVSRGSKDEVLSLADDVDNIWSSIASSVTDSTLNRWISADVDFHEEAIEAGYDAEETHCAFCGLCFSRQSTSLHPVEVGESLFHAPCYNFRTRHMAEDSIP